MCIRDRTRGPEIIHAPTPYQFFDMVLWGNIETSLWVLDINPIAWHLLIAFERRRWFLADSPVTSLCNILPVDETNLDKNSGFVYKSKGFTFNFSNKSYDPGRTPNFLSKCILSNEKSNGLYTVPGWKFLISFDSNFLIPGLTASCIPSFNSLLSIVFATPLVEENILIPKRLNIFNSALVLVSSWLHLYLTILLQKIFI